VQPLTAGGEQHAGVDEEGDTAILQGGTGSPVSQSGLVEVDVQAEKLLADRRTEPDLIDHED